MVWDGLLIVWHDLNFAASKYEGENQKKTMGPDPMYPIKSDWLLSPSHFVNLITQN